MKNNDLNTIWMDLEMQQKTKDKFYQRLVYVELLYRAYIGTSGIPARRFLAIEIPETETKEFDTFTIPKGFTLDIGTPGIKHEGYVACILQAASSDLNDVFTIVAKDVLDNLKNQSKADLYIFTLKRRIEKWRDFFKNPAKNILTEKKVIGLIGELTLIRDLMKKGDVNAVGLWNGPINAAQDFQGENIAVEVKTASTNKLEYVHIASEVQLDKEERKVLFLVAYRIERNDATGTTLPELIQIVYEMLSDQQRSRFRANLTCLGYADEDAASYGKGYSIKECMVYKVEDGFPRLLRQDLPQGVMDIRYRLALESCEKYLCDFDRIPDAIKEYEYGKG